MTQKAKIGELRIFTITLGDRVKTVIGKVKEEKDDSYILSLPKFIDISQDGQGNLNVQGAEYPNPFISFFVIKVEEDVELEKSSIVNEYDEENLKKEIIDWYRNMTSNIEITSDMPPKGKNGLHLV